MAQFSFITLLLAYVFLFAIYTSFKVVRRAFSTPLRSIPGPWHARLCNWRLKVAVLGGDRANYINTLHQRYGTIVRIAPEEVAVNDAASFKEIHRIGGGFLKYKWYEYLNTNGVGICPGIFNMLKPKDHAVRRRLLARGFGQRYLREQWEDAVRQNVELAVSRIKQDAASGSADVLKWWTFMATDITSLLMFGESFNMLNTGVKVHFIEALGKANLGAALHWELPWIYAICRHLPIPSLRSVFHANAILQEQGNIAINNSKAQGYHTTNIFAAAISEAEKGDGTLTDEDIRTEAGNLIVAGSDTTAITLTYLTWSVLKRPELRLQLESEVSNLDGPLTDAMLEELPILNAVIEETLRLYGAAPGTLPRVTPKGGVTLAGYYIPETTIVGTQAYSLHRDPTLFPNPEIFDHTRWLQPTAHSELAKTAFSPFGAGTRICIGVHLARMELRLATAVFFRECRGAKLAASTTDASMEIVNFFLIAPKAHRCEILL